MQQPATIKPQQGGFKVSKPPQKQPKSVLPKVPQMKMPKPNATPTGAPGAPKTPKISGADRRWVDLESARFVAANRDTLDDSHELAVRAHNHAAAATSTFTRQRSAAVCEAFVRKVTKLGAQQYRPAPQRTASAPNTNFPDSLIYLG